MEISFKNIPQIPWFIKVPISSPKELAIWRCMAFFSSQKCWIMGRIFWGPPKKTIPSPDSSHRDCNESTARVSRSSELDTMGNSNPPQKVMCHESSRVVTSRHESSRVVTSRHESSRVVTSRHESSRVTRLGKRCSPTLEFPSIFRSSPDFHRFPLDSLDEQRFFQPSDSRFLSASPRPLPRSALAWPVARWPRAPATRHPNSSSPPRGPNSDPVDPVENCQNPTEIHPEIHSKCHGKKQTQI